MTASVIHLRQTRAFRAPSTTASAGDFTYCKQRGEYYRWPRDSGEFGNGEPEKIPANQVPEGIRLALP